MSDSKIKCVVIEDEHHTTKLMENYISQISQLEWAGSFVSPVDFFNYEDKKDIQIIYLDIQMPNMTGVEFLKLNSGTAEIIVTTAYSEYAIKGYEFDVTDYLLKPVEFSRFLKATQRALKNVEINQIANNIPTKPSDFIILKVDKKLIKVRIDDILYIQSDWNYIYVYTSKQRYMVLSTMKGIEAELASYNFIRIHKSYLINVTHFESVEGNEVLLNTNVKLQVSRSYKPQLLRFMDRL